MSVFGAQHHNSSLTEDRVREMRASNITNKAELARRFGISRRQVARIMDGYAWKHISERSK